LDQLIHSGFLQVSIHSSGTQLQPDVGTILPRAVLQCNARTTKTNKATGKVHQLQGYCVCHLVARPGYCSPLGPWSSAKREKTPNRVARLFDLHRSKLLWFWKQFFSLATRTIHLLHAVVATVLEYYP